MRSGADGGRLCKKGAAIPAARAILTCGAVVAVAAAVVVPGADARPDARGAARAVARTLFDDFSYARRDQLGRQGWIVRTEAGWPGIRGARWSADNVTLVADPLRRGNRLLRMSSWTDGTPEGTSQTQVCHARKYREGTYAARVRFHDAPSRGLDVDQVVETFYAISPLEAPFDPDYSELDWEYLPNAGWGAPPATLFVTSWETARLEPWFADNVFTTRTASLDGWHTLVLQVVGGTVVYFLDGSHLATHDARYYPEVPMSIDFNLWFIDGGLYAGGSSRRWDEEIDWVFHRAGVALTPGQVAVEVRRLRRAKVAFRDTVPPATPLLPSPCNF